MPAEDQGITACRPDHSPPYSLHRGRAWRHWRPPDRPCRGLIPNSQDAETALSPRATRPHGHHGGQSHPQEEALMQGAGRHPAPGGVSLTVCPAQGPGPGPRATRRSHRGVGATSSQGCPCPGAPIPAACGHTHFIHRRALPPRTQVGKKRGKRSRMAGVRRSHAQMPGECSQGLLGDRHPIPRKGLLTGTTHSATPWERGQQDARMGVGSGPANWAEHSRDQV